MTFFTHLLLVVLCFFVDTIVSQKLISPCPNVFQYEQRPGETDRWYGTATVMSDQELTGVWFRVVLDSRSIQLGNWFGEVKSRDNNLGYLIKSPEHKLKANTPLVIKFFIKYNPNEPTPKLLSLRLNAVVKCPEGGVTTEAPVAMGELFTNKPEPLLIDTPQVEVGSSNNIGTSGDRPSLGSDDKDFYHCDYCQGSKPASKPNIVGAATCGTVIKAARPLITHGQVAQEGEFPWHAALYHSGVFELSYICGASLISLNHVITVAHCVTKQRSQIAVNPDDLRVFLGKYYLRSWKYPFIQERKLEKIIVHRNYNPEKYENDIAILKLNEPAELTNHVRPVCIWEGPNDLEHVVNQVGTVVGWGFDETGKVKEVLTKAYMPVVSQQTCLLSYPNFYPHFTGYSTFCAGYQNGTSVCNGDSGGGLVLPKNGADKNNPTWQLRGLVSISMALQNQLKCDSTHYTVFTDVAKYLDFVKAAMRQ